MQRDMRFSLLRLLLYLESLQASPGWLAVSFFEGGQTVKMYSKEEHHGSETTAFFFVLS